MKLALIIPSWRPEDLFPTRTAVSQLNYWQPLGTLYVAAAARKAGHTVRFMNGAFLSSHEIIEQTTAFKPRVAGIYSTTFGWPRAMETAASLKKILPDIFIVAGGPYPIAAREKCLAQCQYLDGVVTGEGEYTVTELMDRLQQNNPLNAIAGLAFRQQNEIIVNPARELIADLDDLPLPARDLLGDASRYIPPPATFKRQPVAVIITSRGCNRRCIYCFQMDKKRTTGVRFRSVEAVVAEIETCLAQGYREIKFIDDSFAADYQRAMAICHEIIKRKLDFTWFASACVNQVDLPLLQTFKKAGCWAILMGAESGVQKNLNTLKKGTTIPQIRQAVTAAKKAGLQVFTPFLIGIPGETYEEALQTIDFACELDPDIANFHALTPFPGTELHDCLESYGTKSENLEDFTYQGAAFVPYTMSRKQICELRHLAFRRFYSRPRFLIRRLLGLRSLADLKASYKGLCSLFWLWLSKSVFSRPSS